MLAPGSTGSFTTPITGRTTSHWSVPIGSPSPGAKSSTGSVGDSYDNALAEAVNVLYKTELIRQQWPWRTVEQIELATLEYRWWWNNARLHGELGMRIPIERETDY